MSTKTNFLVIIGLTLLSIAFISLLPCEDSLLIGFCGLGRIILIGAVILFAIVFSLVFSWISKRYLDDNKNIKKTLIIYLVSCLITLSPLFALITINTISSKISFINYQLMVDKINPKKMESFKISNYSENPVVNKETGKYEGIEVTLDLTVAKTGLYRGSVYIAHPDSFISSVALFGRDNYFSEEIEKDKPYRFSYVLKAEENLLSEKIDGPYYVSILIRFDDENSQWYKYDPGIFLTGDVKGVDKKVFMRMPIKYVEELKTRSYKYTDFTYTE